MLQPLNSTKKLNSDDVKSFNTYSPDTLFLHVPAYGYLSLDNIDCFLFLIFVFSDCRPLLLLLLPVLVGRPPLNPDLSARHSDATGQTAFC